MRNKESIPFPEKYLYQLALRTGQWCNAVLCQAGRFFDALEASSRPLPWEDSEKADMFLADKTFLITAIHHAIVNMERLNAELIMRGDTSFQAVLDAVASEEERKQIRTWRNMNEHDLDYLSNNGHAQKEFVKTIEKEGYRIETNAFTTFIWGDAKLFLLGGIEIDKLLFRFRENMPQIQGKAKEVFEKFIGSAQ